MSPTKQLVALVVFLLFAGAFSTTALADRDFRGGWRGGGHEHWHGDWHRGWHGDDGGDFGLYFGVPLGWSDWNYAPPYYGYPPQVVVPYTPPVYVERPTEGAAPSPAPTYWWYYCAESRSYYPYVKQCPGGWQRVAPQPPHE